MKKLILISALTTILLLNQFSGIVLADWKEGLINKDVIPLINYPEDAKETIVLVCEGIEEKYNREEKFTDTVIIRKLKDNFFETVRNRPIIIDHRWMNYSLPQNCKEEPDRFFCRSEGSSKFDEINSSYSHGIYIDRFSGKYEAQYYDQKSGMDTVAKGKCKKTAKKLF